MATKKEQTTTETIKIEGAKLVEKLNELAREGNIRHVLLKDKHDKTIMQFPMLLGVAGAVIAPVLASIGLIAFFLTECTLIVERRVEKK